MEEKDQKIAELTAKLDALSTAKTEQEKDLIASKAQVLTLQTQLDAATKAHQPKDELIASQTADLATAEQVIAELKAKLAEKPAGAAEVLPQFKVGNQTYELTSGDFNWKGDIVTLERLKSDSDLAKELIKEGVSFLRKLK